MADLPGSEKTRRLLVEELRKGPASADDVAARLGLTTNAVRFHLASLEAEGLVAAAGSRKPPGRGKPAVLYVVTPEADLAFSKAYAPVLEAVLGRLRRSVPGDQVISTLRRVCTRRVTEQQSRNPLSRWFSESSEAMNTLDRGT